MNDKKKMSKEALAALIVFCIIFASGLLIKATGMLEHKGKKEPQKIYETEARTDRKEQTSPNEQNQTQQEVIKTSKAETKPPETTVEMQSTVEIQSTIENETTMEIQTTEESEDPAKEQEIHSYQIVIEDCTWEEAHLRSKQAGGYLVRINSKEEFDYLTEKLNVEGDTKIHFYLGGRRDSDGSSYYWVNDENQFTGTRLDSSDSWSFSQWYDNEPSYMDTGSGANGTTIPENVMNLFCVSGKWYLNDSSDDLSGNYPSLLSGKVGYIIEYD